MAAAGFIRAEMRGDLRLLWLMAPPANLFSPALCQALHRALGDGLADPGSVAIVLVSGLSDPRIGFSGGMDIGDMGGVWPRDVPGPADIVRLLMAAAKPVIVALQGGTLGAGAEIALAAQGRVATADLRFGLRDVLVGSLPAAGATQTLARLIGATEALRLIGRGVTVDAGEAVALGLIDAVAEDDTLVGTAMALARNPPAPMRAPGLRDGRGFQAAVVQARAAAGSDRLQAALADCIAAAQLLPPEQGLAFEQAAAADIAARPEAAALRHAMQADMRLSAQLPGGQAATEIGLWGVGQLLMPALGAGLSVVYGDASRDALLAEVERVALLHEEMVAKGQLAPDKREADWARLRPTLSAASFADLPLIFAAKPGVAGRVVQFGHWPAEAAADSQACPRLLLVAPGFGELQMAAADDGGHALMLAATLRRIGLRFVVTGRADSGVAQSLVQAARSACAALAAKGVSAASIAGGLEGQIRLSLSHGAKGHDDMQASDVRARVFGAMAAAALRMLDAGIVRRASDLDALALAALGIPRSLGGPCLVADQRGLLVLRRDLTLWSQDHPVWTPPPLLDALVSQGARMSDLDMRAMKFEAGASPMTG